MILVVLEFVIHISYDFSQVNRIIKLFHCLYLSLSHSLTHSLPMRWFSDVRNEDVNKNDIENDGLLLM